ncbi:C25 family cysteine peptidase [[Eubacterium] cellulosolvens]
MPEKIKYFIFNAKKSWNITYVILAGDRGKIPPRNVQITGAMAGEVPADLYFADVFDSSMNFDNWDTNSNDVFGEYNGGYVDSVDMYPDVFLGRLPADTEEEIEVLVDKIINYELTACGQPWFDNITMMGSNTFSGTGTPEGEYSCEFIYENYMQDFIPTKIYETDTYDNKDLDLSNSNIVNTINKGSGFVTFHDHGSPQAWFSNGMFNSNDAADLENGEMLSFLNFDACSTGRFDDQDCIAEIVMLNPNGGSIISIGSSRIGWGAFGTDHIKRRSGYFNVHLYEMYNNGEGTVGRIFMGSKISYLDNVGVNDYMDYMTLTEYTLFGDPSLSVGGISLRNISISCAENTSHVIPSNTVEYEITITNNGTISRPIKLNIGGLPENWTGVLNESFVIVPGMTDKKVTLTVTASPTALYEQIAHVEVYAYAAKNKARTISTMTHTITDRIHGVELNTTILEVDVYPEETKGYLVKITNMGNAQDVINLSAALTESLPNWVFNFSASDIQVLPFDYQYVTLLVTPPIQTLMGSYEINITGRLIGLQAEHSIIVHANILRTYGIDLTSTEELVRKYNPGENFTYNLNAANLGNDIDKIKCTIQRAPKEWDIQLNRLDSFEVNAFSQKIVKLFFQIPNQTLVGNYMIRVHADLISNKSYWSEIDIEIYVNQTYGVDAFIDELAVTADPGETKEFNLTLNHLGNGEDSLEVAVLEKPRDWYVNLSRTSISLAPFGDYWVNLWVTPHLKAVTDRYSLKLRVTVMGNMETKDFGLNITVNKISGYEVICPKNKFSIAPGDSQSYRVYITNYGNHEDEISVNVTNAPNDWNITLQSQYILNQNYILGPFNSTTVTVKIITDSRSVAGEYWLCVNSKLKSTEDESKTFLYTTITPFYGVTLESDSTLIRTHPGEDFIITINITNRGNTRDDITRVIAGLPSSWDFKPMNYTYEQLGAYETKTEKILITVPEYEVEREVNLTIRVFSQTDPEQHQEEESNVYVETKGKSDPVRTYNWSDFKGLFLFWILPIILIIIIIIVMGFLIKKQRKEYKEDMEFINEMDKEDHGAGTEYDKEYEAMYGTGAPARGRSPTVPGAPPVARVRSRRLHKGVPPQPPKPPKAGKVGAGAKAKPKKPAEVPAAEKGYEDELNEIECPACGSLVNIEEDACPNCGERFEDEAEVEPEPPEAVLEEDYELHLPDDEEPEFELDEAEVETELEVEEVEDWDADDELEELEEAEEPLDETEEFEELEDEPEELEELEEEDEEPEDDDEIDWELEE